MEKIIEPKLLKGFRDIMSENEIARREILSKIEKIYRLSGFVPIDTPALEYTDVLLGKGGGETEKQVFRFTDSGGRDVALRFDLTVPLARFCALHFPLLTFPFKRYQISKVWRGEKPQSGRFREFIQCDIDILGEVSALSDAEVLLVIYEAFSSLSLAFTVHVNHRGLFNRFLKSRKLTEKKEEILREIDKIAKTGEESVRKNLSLLAGEALACELIDFIKTDENDSSLERIEKLEGKIGEGRTEEGERLREVFALLASAGVEKHFVVDPSIARGLDYYTGIVFESFLNNAPHLGSVASGGRYDNLCALYSKENISGIGASIGIDRLFSALEETGALKSKKGFTAVMFFCSDSSPSSLCAAFSFCAYFKKKGIACEVYPAAKKMKTQYAYAESKGAVWGATLSGDKIELKNLETREVFPPLSAEECVKKILGE